MNEAAQWEFLIMNNLEFILLATISLFVVVGPLSTAPIFLAMTPNNSPVERIQQAKLATIIAAVVLVVFAIFGEWLFRVIGVTINALQVAGGVLLFLIALDMLRAEDPDQKITPAESAEGVRKPDIAVTPLGVPLLAGPGSITTCVLLQSQAGSIIQHGILYLSIIIVMAAAFLILKVSAYGTRWLNPLLLRIVHRLMGLLLAAIAVQFIFNGLDGTWNLSA